jgi:hypothetical protein
LDASPRRFVGSRTSKEHTIEVILNALSGMVMVRHALDDAPAWHPGFDDRKDPSATGRSCGKGVRRGASMVTEISVVLLPAKLAIVNGIAQREGRSIAQYEREHSGLAVLFVANQFGLGQKKEKGHLCDEFGNERADESVAELCKPALLRRGTVNGRALRFGILREPFRAVFLKGRLTLARYLPIENGGARNLTTPHRCMVMQIEGFACSRFGAIVKSA